MTEEQRQTIAKRLRSWDAENLLDAFGSYRSRLTDCNETDLEKYGLIRNEILRRMQQKQITR